MTIKLLALAASVREGSYNKRLLSLAVAEAEANGASVTVLDYAPMSSLPTVEMGKELPAAARPFADALLEHDGLLLASPEYNWSVPGCLKNLIDWASVDPRKPLAKRTCLLLAASPSVRGGALGLTHLRVPLEVLNMWVYPQFISISSAHEAFGDSGLTREKDAGFLTQNIRGFVDMTKQLRK